MKKTMSADLKVLTTSGKSSLFKSLSSHNVFNFKQCNNNQSKNTEVSGFEAIKRKSFKRRRSHLWLSLKVLALNFTTPMTSPSKSPLSCEEGRTVSHIAKNTAPALS